MLKAFQIGQRVGGFTVSEEITGGKFGETWKCTNPISGRTAILKGIKKEIVEDTDPLLAQLDLNTRTREEAKILTALFDKKYPFVPNVYDVFEVLDGRIFFLSEYIHGKTLLDSISEKSLTTDILARIAFLILDALDIIHTNGIVHRDISPDNILLRKDNSVVLIDFGLAKIKSEILVRKYSPQTITPLTKIKYMPPSVLQNWSPGATIQSDESWDLYAAGVLLFELFSQAIIPGPVADINDESLNKLPCPRAIKQLLLNSVDKSAGNAGVLKKILLEELEQKGLLGEIFNQSSKEVVETLTEVNNQLKAQIARGQFKIRFEDFVSYVSRMGLVFTVNPSDKYLTIDVPTKAGQTTIAIDVREDFVMFVLPRLRVHKKNKAKILELINEFNKSLNLGYFSYFQDDGAIRYKISVLYVNGFISFEDFARAFAFSVRAGGDFAVEFDKKFGMVIEPVLTDQADNDSPNSTQ